MENRHGMDDKRNTIILPRPGRKNREKRQRLVKLPEDERGLKIQNIDRSKIGLSRICVWCGNDQQEARPVCRFCRTCQSCGQQPTSGRNCDRCGNHDPDYVKPKRRTIRAVLRPGKPRKNPKRVSVRHKAQTRSRGARIGNPEA